MSSLTAMFVQCSDATLFFPFQTHGSFNQSLLASLFGSEAGRKNRVSFRQFIMTVLQAKHEKEHKIHKSEYCLGTVNLYKGRTQKRLQVFKGIKSESGDHRGVWCSPCLTVERDSGQRRWREQSL